MSKMRKTNVTIPLLLLPGIFFVLFFSSCTTFRNMASWVPFLDPESDVERIKDKDLAKFASTIRPQMGDLDSIYNLACYFQERKKHHLAVGEFRKVVRIDPTHVQAYNGLGVSYDNLGEFPRAIQAYKTALTLNPDLDYVQNNLGYSYLLQGNFHSAIEAFQKATTLNNTNNRYHNNLGMAYARNAQFDLAFEEFKLAGDEAKAHHNIAQFYYQNGLYQEARIHFAKASIINPGDRETRNGLAAAENLSKITHPKNERIAESAPVKIAAKVTKDGATTNEDAAASAVSLAEAEKMEPREIKTVSKEIVKRTRRSDKVDTHDSHQHEFIGYIAAQDTIKPPVPEEASDTNRLYSFNDLSLEISNGNGVRHMARRVGDFLMEKGFEEPFLTNAIDFDQPQTIVYYCNGYLQEAYLVAQEIPGYQNMEKVARLQRPGIKVRVLLGKDLVPFDPLFIKRIPTS